MKNAPSCFPVVITHAGFKEDTSLAVFKWVSQNLRSILVVVRSKLRINVKWEIVFMSNMLWKIGNEPVELNYVKEYLDKI